MASKFRNSGQTCICANRIYVHSWIHDSYVDSLKSEISKLVVGDGMKPGVTQGPLINEQAVQKVEGLVADALQKGARIVTGGKRVPGTTCYEPTLLTGVTQDMDITRTEIFGPVVPVQKFETEDEVLNLANQGRTGLAGQCAFQTSSLFYVIFTEYIHALALV
ncbi:unnamed protein product [Gongylonema pulchrum]|uniref:Succinate-semialdehyde dehydrogenase, mitochondrial n=1 Tax=Gongylonema pulchrum TaxID=637853 RepID=A0A183DE22_9BILA|nr:unnamed protein product [Gongylonema pulchrum]